MEITLSIAVGLFERDSASSSAGCKSARRWFCLSALHTLDTTTDCDLRYLGSDRNSCKAAHL